MVKGQIEVSMKRLFKTLYIIYFLYEFYDEDKIKSAGEGI